jgi:hypothetical protein
MSTSSTAVLVTACLFLAVFLGKRLRALLPEHHLNSDTKDAIKLAVGLVATMSALLIGLLLSSSKSDYDAQRNQVIQMAARIALLDRILALYGPEASPVRAQFRTACEAMVHRMWPDEGTAPEKMQTRIQGGDVVYAALQGLAPRDESQHELKRQAINLALDLGQLHATLVARSVAFTSKPLVVVVVSWLVLIFFSFSVLAPTNATASVALLVSALSVAGAIFLILELDRPLTGLLRIPSEPMVNVIKLMAQ